MATQSEIMLDENYSFNAMICSSLAQVFRVSDRKRVKSWLAKLHGMVDEESAEDTVDDVNTRYHEVRRKHDLRETRNDYMWYLLLVLQNGRLSSPFSEEPPVGEVQPLATVLPTQVYGEVMEASVANYTWLEKVLAEDSGDSGELDETPASAILINRSPPAPPSKFFREQPTPKDGFICYSAVFSNQRS